MEKAIPLLQSLVWPVFILILIFWSRKSILRILEAIRTRIEAGDTLEAGSSGLKLTSTGKLVQTSGPQRIVSPIPPEASIKELNTSAEADDIEGDAEENHENPGYHIVHKARRERSLDRSDYEYYRLRIFLETEPDVDIAKVKKVVYHLVEGFPNPDRTATDPDTQFEIRTSAWGQFYLTADVYLEDREKPLRLGRYLNF